MAIVHEQLAVVQYALDHPCRHACNLDAEEDRLITLHEILQDGQAGQMPLWGSAGCVGILCSYWFLANRHELS